MFGELVEEHRLGEGLARADHLDDLLLAIAGDAVQLDLAVDQHMEMLGRIALVEQRASGGQALGRGMRGDGVQRCLAQAAEQMMTAQCVEHGGACQHGHPLPFDAGMLGCKMPLSHCP